jgi:uncharacterized protein (DUF1330 family)
VLALLGDHGGQLRARIQCTDGPWTEVQLIEFVSRQALEDFQQDPRRLALSALRDESMASSAILTGERID